MKIIYEMNGDLTMNKAILQMVINYFHFSQLILRTSVKFYYFDTIDMCQIIQL